MVGVGGCSPGNLGCQPEICEDPLNIEETDFTTSDSHESFLQISHSRHISYDIQAYTDITRTAKPQTQDPAETQCQYRHSTHSHRRQSTCPVHYVLNRDSNRRPENITEAKCNCNRHTPCLGGEPHSRCLPLVYYIRVLRKYGCENGLAKYRPTVEPIIVGCTCGVVAPTHPLRMGE